jgi:hypothetical protein
MESIKKNSFEPFLGHKVLLYGETDTKKTYYTSRFVKFLLDNSKCNPKVITILDFAPELQKINGLKIGGKISDYYKDSEKCKYYNLPGKIIPPRLEAENRRDLLRFAKQNYEKTSIALKEYNEKPTKILIMNDISIHLHVGDPEEIIKSIKQSETFFGNSYYGISISKNFSKNFSLREKKKIENVFKEIEQSYHTDDFL